MASPEMIERGLAQLGQELGTQADLGQRVLGEVRLRAARPDRSQNGAGIWFSRRRLVAASALGVLASLAGWWLSTPSTLYARVLESLNSAQTVHVSGWSREVFRKWPLEAPQKKAAGAEERHTLEAWYWFDASKEPASYEKLGPVIAVRHGGNFREYQEDVKLLFIRDGGQPRNYAERFSALAEHLKTLDAPGLSKKSLGNRTEGDRTLSGWLVTQGNRIEEFWLDAKSDVPVRVMRWTSTQEGKVQVLELTFSFNEPVPAAVARYEPPKTENIRYGGANGNTQLAWREHVQEIGRRLQNEPIRGHVAILDRENGRTFNVQWTMQTPDGKFWVLPLDLDQQQRLSLSDFVKLRAATTSGERIHGSWRVPREFHDLELRQDLIYADGTPWREWVQVVLDRFGLELVDVVEQQAVWFARHDGRKLKPWNEVDPPVPYIIRNGKEMKGRVAPGVGKMLRPVTMEELLNDFNGTIDSRKLTATLPMIVDETGLSRTVPPFDAQKYKNFQEYFDKFIKPNYCVASDAPYFEGKQSLAMARDWYAKEFGITFVEEQRPRTIHVVRRKSKAE